MPRLNALPTRPEADFPVLSRLLWQALVLGALVALAALPFTSGGTPLFGPLSFWLPATPAAALLTLHREGVRSHFLRLFRKTANDSGRKCALTPVSQFPAPRPRPTNPERPAAYAQAA